MRIGIDVDEVLADFMTYFLKYYNKTYDTNLERNDFKNYSLWHTLGGTETDSKRIIDDYFYSEDFEKMGLIYGSQYGVKKLSKNNELIVITARPEKTYNKTVDWLGKYFPNRFSGIEFSRGWKNKKNPSWKKKDICIAKNIDVLFEDNFDYATECAQEGIEVKLFDCPWNQEKILLDEVVRVYSWGDAVGSLTSPYTKR
ncbi:hypothetical protein HOD61_00270 [archaeon]|jgi:uncharacterized HAD superfamily protein|nr:hypothetical protein [archaeon]